MRNSRHLRAVRAVVVAFGIGVVAMLDPGIAVADPTADASSDSSEVGGPVRGGPDPKTELGVVSPGGSTPPAGAGSVDAGSGPDVTSGPDRASGSTASTGSAETASEPAPGVIVRSSGGALTSDEQEQFAGAQRSDPQPVESQSPAGTEATSVAAAGRVRPRGHEAVAENAFRVSVPVVRMASQPMVPAMSEIPSPTAPLDVVAGDRAFSLGHEPVAVNAMAVPRGLAPVDPRRPIETSLQTFTGALAAALAPFVLPLPGVPLDEPALWAVLAWTRRQFDGHALVGRLSPAALPRQTEQIATDEATDTAGATVDRVDRMTGRVTGRVNLVGERDGLDYELVKPLDQRVGVVTVDGATGRWTFTPHQVARLATYLDDGVVVTFGVAASNGRATVVNVPVDPAEAVVTDTIETGDGLTYGLAAVGDRLCVLSGSDGPAGNGRVKIIDTSTKAIIASVEVGSMPFGLAASGRSLYVGNADDGTVSVVDVASSRLVDVIDVGANPFGLEISGDRLYVADQSGTVSVIDLDDHTELARIPIAGDPFGVAATADRVYVTNYAGGTLAIVDRATHTAVDMELSADPLDVGGYPYFAAVMGDRLYVVNSATNALTIVDGSVTTAVDVAPHTRAVDAIPVDASPVDVVVRGDRLYVSNVNSGSVVVVDVATNQPVENIGVGIAPGLMTATPEGRTIYVADVMSGTVRVITSVRHAAND
ncbi:hypothetical protein [Mycolicibacterium sp.]|uniref:hypothetical protein n=1 Tax=Mycolicibacterium sp. TaxID=2320850 RepID=UPI001A2AE520|nr:hypothetical protein [Mycolicibacterium sp.]MBJ7337602.1 hypothetical protein [Mycolicibacterium sp.]